MKYAVHGVDLMTAESRSIEVEAATVGAARELAERRDVVVERVDPAPDPLRRLGDAYLGFCEWVKWILVTLAIIGLVWLLVAIATKTPDQTIIVLPVQVIEAP